MALERKAHYWKIVSTGCLILALLALILLIVPGPGVRFGLWPWATAVGLLQWAFYIGCTAGILGLFGLFLAAGRKHRTAVARLAITVLIGGGIAGTLYMMRLDALSYVPIHDVTTDLIDPPAFEAIPPRVDTPYIVPDKGRPDLIDLDPMARWRIYHKEAYDDIGPLYLTMDIDDAVKAAEAVARDMGWEIVASDPDKGRLEATAQTFWFGFKDDIVVRISAADTGSRVDVRSVSRIGVSDIGANAKRVRTFLTLLEKKVQQ